MGVRRIKWRVFRLPERRQQTAQPLTAVPENYRIPADRPSVRGTSIAPIPRPTPPPLNRRTIPSCSQTMPSCSLRSALVANAAPSRRRWGSGSFATTGCRRCGKACAQPHVCARAAHMPVDGRWGGWVSRRGSGPGPSLSFTQAAKLATAAAATNVQKRAQQWPTYVC